MTAGSLDFKLGNDPREYLAGMDEAVKANTRLSVSVAGINAAFAAANAGMTKTATNAALTAGTVKSSARALSSAVGSLTMTASLFAGPQVASVLYPVMFLGKELKGLAAGMKLVGISAPMAAAGLAGLAGVVATLTAAYNYAKAAQGSRDTETQTLGSLDQSRAALLKKIGELTTRGKIGKEESLRLQFTLALAPNSAEELYAAVRKVQSRLREIVGPKIDLVALGNLSKFEEQLKLQAMPEGRGKEERRIELEAIDAMDQAQKLAEAAGGKLGDVQELINAVAQRKLANLDQVAEPVAEKGSRIPVTNLERMGFVMGGANNRMNDYARSTMDFTKRTAVAVEKLVSRPPTASEATFD